jgi:hypothetical protein
MTKTVYLTLGTSWFVPLDFDINNNTIECWGAGGGGGGSGGGGGGGAYSRGVNVNLDVGSVISIAIGAGGNAGLNGGDTSFAGLVLAKGGRGNGQGGPAAEGIGTVRYSGGDGGPGGFALNQGGGGGGGAAGANGNGLNGGANSGGTGGVGGVGASPGGGTGGNGSGGTTAGNPGGTAADGYGAGGGGGGGGATSDSYGAYGGPGGDGGLYGGGGGGAGWGSASGGRGGNGLIKITYEPASTTSYLRVVTFNGSGSWTVPDGVTVLTIKVTAGGGGGAYWPPSASFHFPGGAGGNSSVSGPFGTATVFGGAGGTAQTGISAPGGGANVPAGWIVGNGENGIYGRFGTTGGSGGLSGGLGAIWAGRNAEVPGGGGASWSNTNDNGNARFVSSGGGGGAALYTWSTAVPGTVINFTIGSGGTNNSGVSQTRGAGGEIIFSYAKPPIIVPTGFEFVPGKPTGPVGMDSISQAFLGYGDQQPVAPFSISSYYPNNITSRTHSSFPGPINTSVRVLRYGYGIQKEPNYTQSIPNSGPISWGDFRGTYQQLSMRAPILITAANNFEPPFQTYAQYDAIQYRFTGAPQTFNFFNARVIMIECWGAYGRHYNNQFTGLGGYSAGVFVAPAGGELYVYVGGAPGAFVNSFGVISYTQPTTTGVVPGGWNGGGSAYQIPSSNGFRGGGGGATDVRTTSNLNDRIIVAGGGGGGYFGVQSINFIGGAGGGDTGGTSGGDSLIDRGGAGTQSSGGLSGRTGGGTSYGTNGSFGLGGSSFVNWTVCGGGGGWYGGGAGLSGGGGSGYVGGMLLNTSIGSLNFGVPTVNAQPGQTGYIANGLAPNGLVNIFILG